MRKGLAIVWMFAALLLAASSARGQTAVPAFDADVVGVRSDAEEGKTRIDVYTKIPLSNLQFIKAANGFRADYHITADFYELGPNDTKGTRVQSHVWERPVFVDRFEATQSDQHFDAVTQSLAFRPGRYLMEIQVEDEANGRTALEEVPFVVRNLGKSVAVSDLIVIDEYDGDENTISPNVSNRVSTEADGLRFFYEVYANRPTPVQITRELIRMKKAPEKPSIRSIFRGDDEETKLGEVTYMKPSSTVLKKGRHAFVADIPLADIAAGDYLVRVTLEDEEGRRLDQTQKVISAHWTGLDEHIRNLDQAIAQLAYIAKDKEVRHIREAPTAAERLARGEPIDLGQEQASFDRVLESVARRFARSET